MNTMNHFGDLNALMYAAHIAHWALVLIVTHMQVILQAVFYYER